ncbi:hypothetical protein M8J76_017349 [Diaphorina citri]|nr:hypothetical protein M8J76_017349 [Diaphorina citri]
MGNTAVEQPSFMGNTAVEQPPFMGNTAVEQPPFMEQTPFMENTAVEQPPFMGHTAVEQPPFMGSTFERPQPPLVRIQDDVFIASSRRMGNVQFTHVLRFPKVKWAARARIKESARKENLGTFRIREMPPRAAKRKVKPVRKEGRRRFEKPCLPGSMWTQRIPASYLNQ